ncbi:hypothetical protein XH91_30560 [Bradyrhizobium guangzhouense]|uniref:Uncharacterized protein n=1 Tax=Bradyrhizobium guangzhouense TaxID=1325095 RepID=A0AAE5X5S8_9BRAD|nr:hypothetical protein XH91_30560 [Bradyrhizobium guangzhouense]
MADTTRAAFFLRDAAPFMWATTTRLTTRRTCWTQDFLDAGLTRHMAFELLLIAQMIRRPAQALARRWYCRSLFRASRGRFHCAECAGSSSVTPA